MKPLTDKRYSITLEYCGYEKQRYVLRFCGDWLNSFTTYDEALISAIEAKDERQ